MLELMRKALMSTKRDQRGTSSVEYGLLVVAIAAVITLVVIVVGKYVKGAFDNTCDGLNGNVSMVTASCPA